MIIFPENERFAFFWPEPVGEGQKTAKPTFEGKIITQIMMNQVLNPDYDTMNRKNNFIYLEIELKHGR